MDKEWNKKKYKMVDRSKSFDALENQMKRFETYNIA